MLASKVSAVLDILGGLLLFYPSKLESKTDVSQEIKFKTLDLSFVVSFLSCYWFILNSV